MSGTLDIVFEKYRLFSGDSAMLIVYFIILLALFLKNKENKAVEERIFTVYHIIFIAVAICPFTANIIMEYCVGEEVYWRMMWLMPMQMVIAYVATKAVENSGGTVKRIFGAALVCLAIFVIGSDTLTEDNFIKTANRTKLNTETVLICEKVKEDAKEQDIEQIKLATVGVVLSEVRQYNGEILMPYGRKSARAYNDELYILVAEPESDVKKMAKKLRKKGCNYVALYVTQERRDLLENEGLVWLGEYGEYTLFRCV